jgi:hypothetical protein
MQHPKDAAMPVAINYFFDCRGRTRITHSGLPLAKAARRMRNNTLHCPAGPAARNRNKS